MFCQNQPEYSTFTGELALGGQQGRLDGRGDGRQGVNGYREDWGSE